MKTKHTDGQWSQVSGLLKSGDWCIHSHGKHICTMPNENLIENEANAKLIAAAPAMLEALMVCQKEFEQWPCKPSTKDAVNLAIFKATE